MSTSLMIVFIISGRNDFVLHEMTLIGKDKRFLGSEYKTHFADKSANSE